MLIPGQNLSGGHFRHVPLKPRTRTVGRTIERFTVVVDLLIGGDSGNQRRLARDVAQYGHTRVIAQSVPKDTLFIVEIRPAR